MHLAILVTNTDDSAFAERHPRDGEKFTDMMKGVRPDWTTEVFEVTAGAFPGNLSSFDGVIITGSPASVHDEDAWVSRLESLIRELVTKGIPVFGACYGHQAIAKALGGRVSENPGGWVFGRATMEVGERPGWAAELPDRIDQYAAHNEQVTVLPAGARVWAGSDACPVSGFSIGQIVYTTQNHPEMTPGFVTALTEEYAEKLPADIAERARASLVVPVPMRPFAETVARFFEQAPPRD